VSFCTNTEILCGTGCHRDYDGALLLWTAIQDLDIAPSSHFLNMLAALLHSHKCEIPFVLHSAKEHPEQAGPESSNNSMQTNSSSL
jgi:hypothetical protein